MSSRRVERHAVSVAITVAAFVIRFLRVGTTENDHYVYLARAHQILLGAWPVRDFADPGLPLAYLLSAAAAVLAGPTLLTEAILSVSLFAVGATVTFALVRRASGSVLLALTAVAFLLLLPPRLYNAPKMLVPVVAMAMAWRYADGPTTRRAALLGAWAGVAFLFRHDYAVYLGAATAVLLPMCHWDNRTRLATAAAIAVAAGAMVAAPWLVYVQVEQGLGEYLASALRFSAAEGHRTVASWPLVFYATAATPVAALLVGARGTPRLNAAQVAFAAVLTFVSELFFLRDAPGARLPDVYASTAVMIAVIVGRWVREGERPVSGRQSMVAGAALIAVAAAIRLVAGDSLPATLPNPLTRWQVVTTRLRNAAPEIMPDPARAPLVRFIERCSSPDERVLIGGFGPELAVLAHRGFAGGLPDWIAGYYADAADVARARAQLRKERVGMAVMLGGGDSFAASWPAVATDLRARGLTRYPLPLASGPVELWLLPTSRLDASTQLPCAHPQPALVGDDRPHPD